MSSTAVDYLSELATGQLIFREEAGEAIVEGMVVPYGVWSEVDSPAEGHFVESFSYGCLRESFAQRAKNRLLGLFEHGRSRLFGRAPIMEVRDAWEEQHGAFFRAGLLRGLPAHVMDGLRKGVYGASIGAKPLETTKHRPLTRSAYNPRLLEERTYVRLEALDISLTPRPHYAQATVALRSRPDAPGVIYRDAPTPIVASAWRLEAPPRYPRDYIADRPYDFLGDPDYAAPTLL